MRADGDSKETEGGSATDGLPQQSDLGIEGQGRSSWDHGDDRRGLSRASPPTCADMSATILSFPDSDDPFANFTHNAYRPSSDEGARTGNANAPHNTSGFNEDRSFVGCKTLGENGDGGKGAERYHTRTSSYSGTDTHGPSRSQWQQGDNPSWSYGGADEGPTTEPVSRDRVPVPGRRKPMNIPTYLSMGDAIKVLGHQLGLLNQS